MINSKWLITGVLTLSTAFIIACENKHETNKQPQNNTTQQNVEPKENNTNENKPLTCTLDKDLRQNVEKAIKKVFQGNVSVENIRNSEIPELVEVEIKTQNGKTGKVLFDCDGEYMIVGKVVTITNPANTEEENSTGEGGGCLASGMSKGKIKSTLTTLFGTDVDVIEVNDTPISSLYEVVVKDPSGKSGVMYIDCDLKHLILGNLIDTEKGKSLTLEKQKELAKNYYEQKEKQLIEKLGEKKFEQLKQVLGNFVYQLDLIDLNSIQIPKEGVIVYGNPNAKYTIYIISDPQCPFCAKLHDSIKKIIAKRKDVKFEIFMYPLPFHKYAKGISENIMCQEENAKRQEILDKSFEAVKNRNKTELEGLQGKCQNSEQILGQHNEFAKAVKLKGTPLIIFPNGIAVGGAIQTETLEKMIDILSK